MLIRRFEQVENQPVDMDGAAGVCMRLMVGRSDGCPTFSMRQFTVEPGGHTPEHKHNFEHEVLVISGKGVVQGGSTYREIAAGSVIYMPPNETHQFKNTSTEPLSFICIVPVAFNCADGSCKPTPGS